MRVIRLGINDIARCGEANPARATQELGAPGANPSSAFPGHDFADPGRNLGRRFSWKLFLEQLIPLKKTFVIQQVKTLCSSLNENGKIRMRNEQFLPDLKPRVAQVIGPHDQLRSGLEFPRDARQDVAPSNDVFFL